MKREEFMRLVGCPEATRRAAEEKEIEALRLWATVKHAFFTRSGKPRAKPADPKSESVLSDVELLRAEARALMVRACEQERAHQDHWSHVSPHWLRKYGLEETARKVEAAHARFIDEAESA